MSGDCGVFIACLCTELSHRSKEYTALNQETMDLLRSLLYVYTLIYPTHKVHVVTID